MTNNVLNYSYLHTELGASTAEIAELMGKKKNSVMQALRYHGLLRKSLGRDIEEQVAQWAEKRGLTVERQRGDAPYDLLIAGKRIDVKSAHARQNQIGSPAMCYRFQLQDLSNRVSVKNYGETLDAFWLVFLDEPGQPIYQLDSRHIAVQILNIPTSLHTKYPLLLIGYLGEGGE